MLIRTTFSAIFTKTQQNPSADIFWHLSKLHYNNHLFTNDLF